VYPFRVCSGGTVRSWLKVSNVVCTQMGLQFICFLMSSHVAVAIVIHCWIMVGGSSHNLSRVKDWTMSCIIESCWASKISDSLLPAAVDYNPSANDWLDRQWLWMVHILSNANQMSMTLDAVDHIISQCVDHFCLLAKPIYVQPSHVINVKIIVLVLV